MNYFRGVIHIDCYIRVYRSFSLTFNLTGKDSQCTKIILPIMLALCLMLSGTYYAQNYASIIGGCLHTHAAHKENILAVKGLKFKIR